MQEQKLDVLYDRLNNSIKTKLDNYIHIIDKYKSNYILNNPKILYENKKQDLSNNIRGVDGNKWSPLQSLAHIVKMDGKTMCKQAWDDILKLFKHTARKGSQLIKRDKRTEEARKKLKEVVDDDKKE